MKSSHIVFLINDDVRAIEAKYEETGKTEIFKTLDPTVQKDDMVVVESGTRWGMTVVKVTAVDVDVDFDHGPEIKWVSQKIDVPGFDALLAQEKQAIDAAQAAEKKRRKDELRASMFKNHEDKLNTLKLANHVSDEVTE